MRYAEVPLRRTAEVLVSNVDKKSTDGELPVRLVNYTDVYYRSEIKFDQEFMTSTASPEQVQRFRVQAGDSIITKDSESPDDIAIPTHITSTADDLVCGYHLAILRPRENYLPKFLTWALRGQSARDQFALRANGMTRFGLTYDAIQSVRLPVPPLEEQRRIADFLDDQTTSIDKIIAARRRQAALSRLAVVRSLDDLFNEGAQRPLQTLLKRTPNYGVLVPRFTDSDGIQFIRVNDLDNLGDPARDLVMIDREQSNEYRRTVVSEGDVLISVVGSLDKAAIVPAARAGSNIARAVSRLVPRTPELGYVIWAWTRTTGYMTQARLATSSDTAQPTLNMGDLRKFHIAVPSDPRFTTRVKEVISECGQRDAFLNRSVALFQEFKRSLISAAVSGEFDVSSAGGLLVD